MLVAIAVALVAGCAGPERPAFLQGADDAAPVLFDTDQERVKIGRTTCIVASDGVSPDEIAASLVKGAQGHVLQTEAARFVPFALQHCAYLLSSEAEAVTG